MTTCINECLLCLNTDKVKTGFNWFGPVIAKIAFQRRITMQINVNYNRYKLACTRCITPKPLCCVQLITISCSCLSVARTHIGLGNICNARMNFVNSVLCKSTSVIIGSVWEDD